MVLLARTLIILQGVEQLRDRAPGPQRLPYLLLATECWQLHRGGPQRWRCGGCGGEAEIENQRGLSSILKGDLRRVGCDR